MPNGVAFHPTALNCAVGLKSYHQKLLKILFNCTNFNYNLTLLTKLKTITKAASCKRSGGKAGYMAFSKYTFNSLDNEPNVAVITFGGKGI